MDRFARLSGDERRLYFVQTAERMRLSPQIIETALGGVQGWSMTVDEDDPDRQTLLYAYPS
ncbi:MAG: hypothetical protein WCK00_12645, partial [Deltaproteobacteria bacterium]